MTQKEKEIDRVYDMFTKGYIPKPIKALLILVSLFFGPIIVMIEKISEKSSKTN